MSVRLCFTVILFACTAASHAGETARFPIAPELAGAKLKFIVSPGGRNVLVQDETSYDRPKIQMNEHYLGESYGAVHFAFTPDGSGYAVYFTKNTRSGFMTSLFGDKNREFVYLNGRFWGPYLYVEKLWYSPLVKGIAFMYTETGSSPSHLIQAGDRVIQRWTPEWDMCLKESSGQGSECPYNAENVKKTHTTHSDKKGHYLSVTGRTFGPYREIPSVWFSLDGRRFIFQYLKGNRGYVQTESKLYGPYAKVFESRISAGGIHAFTYHTSGKDFLRIGGRVHGPLSMVPKFLDDSHTNYTIYPYKRFLPVAAHGQYQLYYAGGVAEIAEKPSRLIIGPRGDYSFTVELSSYKRGEINQAAVINDRLYGPYERIYGPCIDREGSGYIFGHRTGTKAYCDVNGKKFGPYERILDIGIQEGNYWFHYHREGRHLMINGKSYGMLDYSWEPVFAPRGDDYAFLCRIGPSYFIQMRNRRLGPFNLDESKRENELYNPRVVGDGIFARYGKSDGLCMWYKGREYGPCEWGDIVQAEDGEAYLVMIREGHVIVDNLK